MGRPNSCPKFKDYPQSKSWFTALELAAMTQVSVKTVYANTRAGHVRSIFPDGPFRYHREEVKRFLLAGGVPL